MPVNRYFKGHGRKVAASMRKRYGSNWKNVFYGRVNNMRKGTKKERAAQPKRAPGVRRRSKKK